MQLVQEAGPYDGHPAEWWQEKFRFYRGLRQTHEKHINRRKEDLQREFRFSPDQVDAQACVGDIERD
jgi:hypothetical protein